MLDCESLAELKNLGSALTMSAGQTLVREGEAATRVFTLTRGSLKLHTALRRGGRKIVGFLSAGDFLGVSVNGKCVFSAEMVEDGELCSFGRGRFDTFIAENPAMERELIHNGYHELSAARLQRAFLGHQTAAGRIATLLLALAERSGRRRGDRSQCVRLPMSPADLAGYLDLSEQTVTSMFSRFEIARLIRSVTRAKSRFSACRSSTNWPGVKRRQGFRHNGRPPKRPQRERT